MTSTLRPALIGDPNLDRFGWLKRVLDEDYGLDAVHAKTFAELLEMVKQSNKAREEAEGMGPEETATENDWLLIFIADNLRPQPIQRPTRDGVKSYFTTLESWNEWGDLVPILISAQDTKMDWRAITRPRVVRLSSKPEPEEQQNIHDGLDGVLPLIPSAQKKVFFDEGDRPLREQIRALSERRKVKDGKNHLAVLISKCIDCSKVERVEIKSLGQGKSGASVFRLYVKPKADEAAEVKDEEFVLKLCQAGAVWKLVSEISGHMRAEEGAGVPGYKTHVPALKRAHFPASRVEQLEQIGMTNRYIVRSGHWYATRYDFLGGEKFGKFIDLETALICSAEELERKTADTAFAAGAANASKVSASRELILDTILRWLCENWYANSEGGNLRREEIFSWDVSDADEQKYITLPPYKLTGRMKGWIQGFLNSPEAEMGPRFFANWERQREKVFRLVSEDPPTSAGMSGLAKPLPFLLSQVHGDLNANNILVWLKHGHPFLIDFPFYQEAGHALQDFARLEVELKFALLDRQKDSPEKRLKAFEHTYSQMSIWQEMENHLLEEWDKETPRWRSGGYAGNVRLYLRLVQLIRQRAQQVQQNDPCPGPPAGDFLTEYLPPLLYHTVRAISYPSLSVFKRLLAVYSAGSILTKLNCYTDLD